MEPLKVLFVDDDTDLGNIINIGLATLGYRVHFQNSLLAINEVIDQFSPSIIVLDVEIGDDNGIEKAREITQKFPSIPILFVSSHTDISYITEGLEVGDLDVGIGGAGADEEIVGKGADTVDFQKLYIHALLGIQGLGHFIGDLFWC